VTRSRSLALIGAGALLIALASAASTSAAPKRYVICDKTMNWVPVDYDGCRLTFSKAVKRTTYFDFANLMDEGSQWAGPSLVPPVAAMRCRRGGMANLVKINPAVGGLCVWNETWEHRGDGDHPNHQWQCEVTSVVTVGPTGKMRTRKGRVWTQWKVTGVPLQDLFVVQGEYPFCDKQVPEDTWTTIT
jgi:hypothetical protein